MTDHDTLMFAPLGFVSVSRALESALPVPHQSLTLFKSDSEVTAIGEGLVECPLGGWPGTHTCCPGIIANSTPYSLNRSQFGQLTTRSPPLGLPWRGLLPALAHEALIGK